MYSLHFRFIWNFFGILKGPLQAKKKLFSQYMEFRINQLRKITDIYCIQTVCKTVLGVLRKKPIRVPLPSCVTAVIWQKFNSPDFVGFKYPQT